MFVRTERKDAVTTIILARPECGNMVSSEMGVEVIAMLDAACNGQLVVIRGEGEDFCRGRDMGALRGKALTALETRASNTEPVLALMSAVRRCPVPVLAVVQGQAVGLGCGLASICDLTLAAESASFRLPEMAHGIPPCLALSAMIDRAHRKHIMHLVYGTEAIGAYDAQVMGIVGQVVPDAELEERAEALVSTIARQPPAAVRALKEYMRSAPAMDSQGAADFGSNLLAGVLSSSVPH